MKKYHVLYDWIYTELARLSDSEIAEGYALTLAPQAEASFTTLTEEIRGLGVELVASKANRIHFNNWGKLQQAINLFASQFPNYPDERFNKLKAFITVAAVLVTTGAPLDEDDINPQLFELRALSKTLPFNWFARENASVFENSLVVFCCDDIEALGLEILRDASQLSPRLAFHVLATLIASQDVPRGHIAIIKRAHIPIPNETVEAFVYLHVVAQGKAVHVPRQYSASPQTGNLDETDPLNPYHQWNEILGVLSEYNSRTEPLLKFLTIYHVVENFMFKRPIVELEAKQNGRMFSIRQFRQMYEQVEKEESKALGKLIVAAFQIQVTPTVTLSQSAFARWLALSAHVPVPQIDEALTELGISTMYGSVTGATALAPLFRDLVYRLRCAIVHNKETEFHLTYSTMTVGFTVLIELFLLPALEELCFILIGRTNTFLWYSNRNLKLY